MYLLLFKIAVYLWIGSIGDTTEFQFAFHSKIMQNYIFEATNCRWIILIFSLFKVFFQLYHTITSPCICLSIVLGRLGEHSISWKPLSFALCSSFPRLFRVLPTSRVFTSGYVNMKTILHFFNSDYIHHTCIIRQTIKHFLLCRRHEKLCYQLSLSKMAMGQGKGAVVWDLYFFEEETIFF